MSPSHINASRHPIGEEAYARSCRDRLDEDGALVLEQFFSSEARARVIDQSIASEPDAFHARSTHNVYLTPPDAALPADHPYNRQVESSKGLIADDQIPADSPLRDLYEDPTFRTFLCRIFGIAEIHPYADRLSSINVHFASAGRELGWHFDNSSFAVTMLLQAPEAGGEFHYVPRVRTASDREAFDRVARVLDGAEAVKTLSFAPGDLVLFRGREALHRVTPTLGPTTRMLVVFAYNDEPGVSLSESAMRTFYGRTLTTGPDQEAAS